MKATIDNIQSARVFNDKMISNADLAFGYKKETKIEDRSRKALSVIFVKDF